MKTITIYIIAMLVCSTSAFAQWTLSGSTVYPSSTTYNVNIGSTAAATYPFEINKSVSATTAKFGATNPVCFVANSPMVGFNILWNGGYQYFSTNAGGIITFGQEVSQGFSFNTAPSGTAGTAATLTSRMAITNAGNIGIGTINPNYKTHIHTASADSYLQITSTTTGTTATDGLMIGSGVSGDAAFINRENTSMQFYTNNTERMRITSAGDLGIIDGQSSIIFPAVSGAPAPMIEMFASGTTNADRMVIAHSAGFPTYGLQYQDGTDKFNFLSSGSPVLTVDLGSTNVGIGTSSPTQKLHVSGNILSTGNITPSDIRLKKNIKTLEYGLNEVMKLHPVSYNWKNESDGKKVLGLIAQETLLVTPEIVEQPKEASDYYGMNYVQLVPVLIKAIQEQQALIANQNSSIAEMKAELAELRKMVMAQQPKEVTTTTASVGKE